MQTFLDFEKPVAAFVLKISELRSLSDEDGGIEAHSEVESLQKQADEALAKLYQDLTPWQKTQVARHPDRPHAIHYIQGLLEDFTPIAGDRHFGEDQALIAGFGRFRGRSVAVLGQEKGSDTDTRLKHNFGMAMPEGYRKAIRLMNLAEQFHMPVISLIDTAGAYPGISAEERGQAEAIAASIETCLKLTVPNAALVIGEGGSGGAVAIATANQVMMMEHAIYTVASPEASASILWRDSSRAADAATNMMITAKHLKEFGVIDSIVEEPTGGAHRDHDLAIKNAGDALESALNEFIQLSPEEVRAHRHQKFRQIGAL